MSALMMSSIDKSITVWSCCDVTMSRYWTFEINISNDNNEMHYNIIGVSFRCFKLYVYIYQYSPWCNLVMWLFSNSLPAAMATRWWQVSHCMLQWPLGDHVSQVPSQLGYRRVTPGLGHVSDSTIQTQSGYLNCVVLSHSSHSMSDKTSVRLHQYIIMIRIT